MSDQNIETINTFLLHRQLSHILKNIEQRVMGELGKMPNVNRHIKWRHFQYVILNLEPGKNRLTELSSRCHVSQQALGKLVSELENMGYIVRDPDPLDNRATQIELTKSGESLLNAINLACPVVLDDMASVYGHPELKSLRNTAGNIVGGFK